MQIVKKLNSNCDILKNSNCEKKNSNSNCDKIQKHKVWQLKNPIVTKLNSTTDEMFSGQRFAILLKLFNYTSQFIITSDNIYLWLYSKILIFFSEIC